MHVCLILYNRECFELRKTPHRVHICLIPFNVEWFGLRKTLNHVPVYLIPFNREWFELGETPLHVHVCLIAFGRWWFELRKTPHRVPDFLITFNREWFELGKTRYRVPVYLTPCNREWFELTKALHCCLSVWFRWISFISNNNGFRAKMYGTLEIDLFIRYNFCRKYFSARSAFMDIERKNLLKTFFLSFYLENQICGYFYHHICNQLLKIRGYSQF